MGAIYREEVVHANNVKEAWEILMEAETNEYGNDSYNGSFNQCSLRRCLKSFDKWNDKNKKAVEKFLGSDELDGRLSKWEADYIDCGVEYYYREKLVKKAIKNPAPKFENVFQLNWIDNAGNSKSKTYKDKVAAEKDALYFLSKEYKNVNLTKEKKAVTNNKLYEYTREVKTFKTKPKGDYKEFHRYIFLGYCPE